MITDMIGDTIYWLKNDGSELSYLLLAFLAIYFIVGAYNMTQTKEGRAYLKDLGKLFLQFMAFLFAYGAVMAFVSLNS